MTENIVIQVSDLTKMYKLYRKPSDRLRDGLGLTRKKLYQEHYALNHVSFSVREGECVGIIGSNGSGKSTLLKIITGVLSPTQGGLEVKGRISALLELGAGFNMEYTGIENIRLNGAMQGFTDKEIQERMQTILDFADIGDYIYQPVKTYSSGMFVRLAFALAINIDPEILIVDEALSVGDVFFQSKCYHKFEEFKKQGRTILFVSHDLSSVAKYCDRVVLLNKGNKIGEGSAREMIDAYKQILVGQEPVLPSSEPEDDAKRSKMPDKGSFQKNPRLLEYGEKQARIIDYCLIDEKGLATNTIEKGSRFQIRMSVLFSENVTEPILAYTFKNVQGTELTGTNTMFEGAREICGQKGRVCTVTFTQNMDLQGGNYLLSFGCTGYKEGDFHVFHRLYDACSVVVVSQKNTVGVYDMNSVVEVEDEDYEDWQSGNR